MTKKTTTPKTKVSQMKELVKAKKVFYAVNDRNTDIVADDELWIYNTLEEAYNDHVRDYGADEPMYAYKIEFMGQVAMQLTIKP